MKRIFLTLLLLFGLIGCDSQPQVQRDEFYAMGTIINLSFYDIPENEAAQLSNKLRENFKHLHQSWNPWQSGVLGETNRMLLTQSTLAISPSIRDLVVESSKLSEQSEGLFNPAIGSLVKLWGFHQEVRPEGPPPSDAAIQKLLAKHPSMKDLQLDDLTLHSSNNAVQLDFGGFAKGVSVDLAIAELQAAGVKNAIVNAGGDLRAIGSKNGQPWVIGVRDPRSPGILASIKVSGDESVFTSGDYERFFEYNGKRYHHILDPRSGYPATGLTSVTVIHDRAAVADAVATALLVAGPKDWSRIAKKMDLQQVMVVDEAGAIYMTPQMESRVEFLNDATSYKVVTP